jgi:hypothetical protein
MAVGRMNVATERVIREFLLTPTEKIANVV